MGNREFIQLDDSWKGACFVAAKSWLYLHMCAWSLTEILVTQQGFCILEGTWKAHWVHRVSAVRRQTHTRRKAHVEPNFLIFSSLAGSEMEHKSCDHWLLAELLHVQFCFCQSRVTHMLHAGLWPGPLKWFMAVLILCTFSGRHKSASCWFCFVGLFVFFSLAPASLALLDPLSSGFYLCNEWTETGDAECAECCILCLWTCCIMLCFCASHTLQ